MASVVTPSLAGSAAPRPQAAVWAAGTPLACAGHPWQGGRGEKTVSLAGKQVSATFHRKAATSVTHKQAFWGGRWAR